MATPELLELTCVCCPVGCTLAVERISATEAHYVSGAGCARGKRYAPAEALHPERVVTTTISVANVAEPVSVRTSAPVPCELMAEVVRAAKAAAADLAVPIELGDVLVANICDTGADLIATKAAH